MNKFLDFLKKQLGPGIVYAGACVGVSHIVQSIRAGEKYGFLFILAIIVIHIVKYPSMYFASAYTLGTKENIIKGYFRLNKWFSWSFILFTFLTMFIILAVLTLMTNSILFNLLQIEVSTFSLNLLNVGTLTFCCLLIFVGKYSLLDKLMKVILLLLFLFTCLVLFFSFKNTNFTLEQQLTISWKDVSLAFLITFMGWMPAPLDVGVWNSLWTEQKIKQNKEFNFQQGILDFKIGYWIPAFMGFLFIGLGALNVYGKQLPNGGVAFVKKFIEIYTANIGNWSFFFIAFISFMAMFTTLLSAVDAYYRVVHSIRSLLKKEAKGKENEEKLNSKFSILIFVMIISVTGIILSFFKTNLIQLVTFATALAFLSSVFFAILNYKIMFLPNIDQNLHPQRKMKFLVYLAIIYFIVFSILYLVFSLKI